MLIIVYYSLTYDSWGAGSEPWGNQQEEVIVSLHLF